MNNELYDFVAKSIKKVLDEYDSCFEKGDYSFEMADIPEHINDELLHSKYNNDETEVYGRFFWLDDNDSDLDCAMEEVINFCLSHKVVAYSINLDDFDDGFVYVAFVFKRW